MDTVSNVVTWDLALSFPKAVFLLLHSDFKTIVT